MILGVGNDIIEIDRVKEAIETQGDRFIKKLFTKREQAYCKKFNDPIPHYAARFSAKEAIVKALGVGFGEMAAYHDIEIINNDKGKPEVFFSDVLNSHFNHPEVLISISHCKNYVATVAIRTK
ncbi:MAG TPA: holo-ACP synthase [Rhabdochlamydiaceae bacterium]|jgi:holo-[acyl-carrier protein] synthase|nr:holo-ACP synthase [Rhabdochlamydiaceae bacterium]